MIKLNEHRVALVNLGLTIDALATLEHLIEYYSDVKKAPVSVKFDMYAPCSGFVQIDRDIMVAALQDQRQKLIDYLAGLGIDAQAT